MKTIFTFIQNRILLVLFLFFYLAFSLLTYKDYGLTNDEFFVYTRGKYFYTKVRGNDQFLQKGFAVHDRNNQDLLINNSTYPAFLYVFNDSENIEVYHLLNMFFAAIIFIALYEIVLFIYNKPSVAIAGPLFLFFTPRFLGDIPANPKDVPFAILYFVSLVSIFITRKWEEKIRILILGITIGLTASLRIIGFSLVLVYVLFRIIELVREKKESFVQLAHLFLEAGLISLLSFLMFLVSMPYAGADPFNHTLELLKAGTSFPWYGTVLFLGKEYLSKQLPFTYLFVWILITTPVFIVLFSIVSFFMRSKKSASLVILVSISLIFQFALYFLFKPVIYNGLRHYLFLVPQIVLLAALFFGETKGKWRVLACGFIAINVLLVSVSYVQLHPYEYVYFNELTGGLKNASGQFELDYWGASEKEALLWLKDYLQKNNSPQANIFTCSKSYSNQYYVPEYTDVNPIVEKAEYVVCQNSEFVQKTWGAGNIRELYRVSRQGIPLQYIFSVKNDTTH